MNREEAMLILQVYRPGGRDADDPQFIEALALAKRDPELAAWFAEQQKFDALVSGGLRQVRAPHDLRAKILAGEQKQRTVEPAVSFWWQNLFSWHSPISWAMAAAVLIFLSMAVLWNKHESSANFANYRGQMVRAAENDTHHVDVLNSNMKQVLAWLGEHQGENNLVLPPAFSGATGLVGCRVLDWHGQTVSMLCYKLKGSAHMDLFVAKAGAFPDAPPPDKPQFVKSDGMATASWSHDGMAYLIVGHGGEAILKKFLQPEMTAQIVARNFDENFLE
jgi:anti-sigma factor RsiW